MLCDSSPEAAEDATYPLEMHVKNVVKWHQDRNLIEGSTDKDQALKLLQEQFPEDQSFDFEEGALMGLWRIIIPKKEIIKNL